MSPRLTFVFVCLILILLANLLIANGYTNHNTVSTYDNFLHDVVNCPSNPKFNLKVHIDNINLFEESINRNKVREFNRLKNSGKLTYLHAPKEIHDKKMYINDKIKHTDHVNHYLTGYKTPIERFVDAGIADPVVLTSAPVVPSDVAAPSPVNPATAAPVNPATAAPAAPAVVAPVVLEGRAALDAAIGPLLLQITDPALRDATLQEILSKAQKSTWGMKGPMPDDLLAGYKEYINLALKGGPMGGSSNPAGGAAGSFIKDLSNTEGGNTAAAQTLAAVAVSSDGPVPGGPKGNFATTDRVAVDPNSIVIKTEGMDSIGLLNLYKTITAKMTSLGVTREQITILLGANPPASDADAAKLNRTMKEVSDLGVTGTASSGDIGFLRKYHTAINNAPGGPGAIADKNPFGYGLGRYTEAPSAFSVSAAKKFPGTMLPNKPVGWDADVKDYSGGEKSFGQLSSMLQNNTKVAIQQYVEQLMAQNRDVVDGFKFRRAYPNGPPTPETIIGNPSVMLGFQSMFGKDEKGVDRVAKFQRNNADLFRSMTTALQTVNQAMTGNYGTVNFGRYQ